MPLHDFSEYVLVIAGGLVMTYVLLSAIGNSAVAIASGMIEQRRWAEARRREADAAAEAAGRAASLEPLALNADGMIEEPIEAQVEKIAA